MPKGPIVSCVAGGRDAATVFEGVVRLRERYGVEEELKPVTSLREVREVEGRGVLQGASALITDLRSPVKAGFARCPDERDALAQILAGHPSLPVVVVAEAREAARLATDPDLPIREVVLRGEEDDPATVALMLVRLRARHPEREVLEGLPRSLLSIYHLALARAYRPSKRIPGEKELVEWSGRDLRVARRDFRRAGLRPPGECATLMRLVATLEAIHQGGRDVDDAARRFGFTDRPTLHQTVENLTNTPPHIHSRGRLLGLRSGEVGGLAAEKLPGGAVRTGRRGGGPGEPGNRRRGLHGTGRSPGEGARHGGGTLQELPRACPEGGLEVRAEPGSSGGRGLGGLRQALRARPGGRAAL